MSANICANKVYETEEEVRDKQRDIEPLMNELI
jgi:hypothetical protein